MQDLKNRHLFHDPVAMRRSESDNIHTYMRIYINTHASTDIDHALWAIQITNTVKPAYNGTASDRDLLFVAGRFRFT